MKIDRIEADSHKTTVILAVQCQQPKTKTTKGTFCAQCYLPSSVLMRSRTDTLYLWDVDSGPEQLKVLPHLLRFELGVEDGELGEHAHVSPLQTQRSLQQSNELLKVPPILIVADQVLQLVSVDHYVKATDLCQPKLLAIHTCKTYLTIAGEEGKWRRKWKGSAVKVTTFNYIIIRLNSDRVTPPHTHTQTHTHLKKGANI